MHLNTEALISAALHPVNLLDLILTEDVLVRLLKQLRLCIKPIALH